MTRIDIDENYLTERIKKDIVVLAIIRKGQDYDTNWFF
jgi:hypothetical protein